MATDVTLFHTIDDDITFERVRHMPRRTQFVSNHRKLSWQYDKQMKKHERDQKLSDVEMSRAKTVMAEKLNRLQDARKQVEMKKVDPGLPDRRFSEPCLTDLAAQDVRQTTGPHLLKHSLSASSFPAVVTIPEDGELTHQPSSHISRQIRGRGRSDMAVNVPDDAPQAGTNGRLAAFAVGTDNGSHLPPHLIRRLSEFMESTSSLLLSAQSNKSKGTEGKSLSH